MRRTWVNLCEEVKHNEKLQMISSELHGIPLEHFPLALLVITHYCLDTAGSVHLGFPYLSTH